MLATGARERPRPARLIPGDRPEGVYTTGQLQNLVHLQHAPVGRRAVVVGAELVSWSAVLTLREAGCDTVLMTSGYHAARVLRGAHPARPGRSAACPSPPAPGWCGSSAGGGWSRSRSSTSTPDDDASVACDTVVTTGDWIPDNELARSAGLELDPATRGPVVDTAPAHQQGGVFAAGNLLHPVDTADVAALDGAHVAEQVRRRLAGLDIPGAVVPPAGVRVVAEPPLRWVTPQIVRPGDPVPARHRYLLWADSHVDRPRVEIVQDGRVVAARRLPWPAAPGRVFRIPAHLFTDIRLDAGPVQVRLT